MRRYLSLIAFTMLAFNVGASDSQTFTKPLEIKEILVAENGGFVLFLKEELNPICQFNGTAAHIWPSQQGVNSNGAKNMLSAALTAKTMGLKVSLRYSGANSSCYVRQIKF